LAKSDLDSLIEFNNMFGFFLPFSFSNEERLHVVCEYLVKVFKIGTYRFVHLISFDTIDIFTIGIEIFSGDIKVFGCHDVHAFSHLEPSDHEIVFVSVESLAFVSLVEMLDGFVELDAVVSFFPVYSVGQGLDILEGQVEIAAAIG
jgi:hypothetical protein